MSGLKRGADENTSRWPSHPVIYEINTWVWLTELATKYGRSLTLANVPDTEWDALAAFGFDAIWFMGIWERSSAGRTIANRNETLLQDFRRALPDFRSEDNVGSPYCVRRYLVDPYFGGPTALASARQALAKRGIKLILDFVPNHVAPDHPWLHDHPDYFIQGSREDIANDPASFVTLSGKVFACGRDPYFPAWQDVVQLNAFSPGLRDAVRETLTAIAEQCDGVRCDMAMLLLNPIFERTWGSRAGAWPASEFWTDVIPAIKRAYPHFLFLAEAYWDQEWALQQLGFDYCYDKRLYDRLEHNNAESTHLHLCADLAYQTKLVRFIENHDEPRAAATFPAAKARAAAIAVATIPGALLLHEGQLDGCRIRLPVFLGRRAAEPVDEAIRTFYGKLLQTVATGAIRRGQWQLCEPRGWPDNPSYRNLLAWCWRQKDNYQLIVINLGGTRAQGRIRLPWEELRGRNWRLVDSFTGQRYERAGDEMCDAGLYVDLDPWGFHCLGEWQALG